MLNFLRINVRRKSFEKMNKILSAIFKFCFTKTISILFIISFRYVYNFVFIFVIVLDFTSNLTNRNQMLV